MYAGQKHTAPTRRNKNTTTITPQTTRIINQTKSTPSITPPTQTHTQTQETKPIQQH